MLKLIARTLQSAHIKDASNYGDGLALWEITLITRTGLYIIEQVVVSCYIIEQGLLHDDMSQCNCSTFLYFECEISVMFSGAADRIEADENKNPHLSCTWDCMKKTFPSKMID